MKDDVEETSRAGKSQRQKDGCGGPGAGAGVGAQGTGSPPGVEDAQELDPGDGGTTP